MFSKIKNNFCFDLNLESKMKLYFHKFLIIQSTLFSLSHNFRTLFLNYDIFILINRDKCHDLNIYLRNSKTYQLLVKSEFL